MDKDQVVVDFLNSSRQKISDFIHKHGSDPELRNLLNTTREISECVDNVTSFLKPCFSEDADSSIKKYEDCVYINRNVDHENEIASLLQEIQNESTDFLSFLENLQVTLNSFYLISGCNGDDHSSVDRKKILRLHSENQRLASEIENAKGEMLKNEAKISELEETKDNFKEELHRCSDALSTLITTELDTNQLNKRLMLYAKLQEYNNLNVNV